MYKWHRNVIIDWIVNANWNFAGFYGDALIMDCLEKQNPGYQTPKEFAATRKALTLCYFINQNLFYLEPTGTDYAGKLVYGLFYVLDIGCWKT